MRTAKKKNIDAFAEMSHREDPESMSSPNYFSAVVNDDVTIRIDSQASCVSLELKRMNGHTIFAQICELKQASRFDVFFAVLFPL